MLSAHRVVVTVMLSLVITAISSLTANECVGSFLALDPPFNLRSYDLYETWFDDNSIMTLAQAGNYKGVDDIEEYVRFVYPSSPYIATVGTLREDLSLVSFDPEKRSCVMMGKYHNRLQLSEMAGNELFEIADMSKLEWRFDDQKFGNINVYCAPLSLGPGTLCGPRCVADKPHRLYGAQTTRVSLATSSLRCRRPPSTTSSARRCMTRARISGRPTN